jgi:hypothetical protein
MFVERKTVSETNESDTCDKTFDEIKTIDNSFCKVNFCRDGC